MDNREFIIYNLMRTLEVMKMFRDDWELLPTAKIHNCNYI
jgi:hypothetical protein